MEDLLNLFDELAAAGVKSVTRHEIWERALAAGCDPGATAVVFGQSLRGRHDRAWLASMLSALVELGPPVPERYPPLKAESGTFRLIGQPAALMLDWGTANRVAAASGAAKEAAEREVRKLENAVDVLLSRIGQPTDEPVPDERPKPSKSASSASVNARMLDTFQKRPESRGWTAREWAEHLGCSHSSVIGAPVWQSLKVVKAYTELSKRHPGGNKRRRGKPTTE